MIGLPLHSVDQGTRNALIIVKDWFPCVWKRSQAKRLTCDGLGFRFQGAVVHVKHGDRNVLFAFITEQKESQVISAGFQNAQTINASDYCDFLIERREKEKITEECWKALRLPASKGTAVSASLQETRVDINPLSRFWRLRFGCCCWRHVYTSHHRLRALMDEINKFQNRATCR